MVILTFKEEVFTEKAINAVVNQSNYDKNEIMIGKGELRVK